MEDVEILNEGMGWVIITDKQKGMKQTIDTLLPNVEHRTCVRHLHENFKLQGHEGLVLKQQLWKIARTTTVSWFKEEMNLMLKLYHNQHTIGYWSDLLCTGVGHTFRLTLNVIFS